VPDTLSVPVKAVGVSGCPLATMTPCRLLLQEALRALGARQVRTELIDLTALPAEALLWRKTSPAVQEAIASVLGAQMVVVSTPVYRATYSGALKVFFDLLPQDALAGKTAVAIATGSTPGHLLAIDHGLRPLLASLGAVTVPTGVYGTDLQFKNGQVDARLLERLDRAVGEAVGLTQRTSSASSEYAPGPVIANASARTSNTSVCS
jgi:FMN reductase